MVHDKWFTNSNPSPNPKLTPNSNPKPNPNHLSRTICQWTFGRWTFCRDTHDGIVVVVVRVD